MGPVKRPAPDALEETELFRKVPAAFWGIEVVTDAISHGGLGEDFTVLFLAAKDFPIFWVFSNSPIFPPFVFVCHDWLTGCNPSHRRRRLRVMAASPIRRRRSFGRMATFQRQSWKSCDALRSLFKLNMTHDHTYHYIFTWHYMANFGKSLTTCFVFDFGWYCTAVWGDTLPTPSTSPIKRWHSCSHFCTAQRRQVTIVRSGWTLKTTMLHHLVEGLLYVS